MSFVAALRLKLAFAALTAIVVPTFLPALHLLPGLGHGDCACSVHRSPDHVVHAGDATCAHGSHGHACGSHATPARSASPAEHESRDPASGWTEDSTEEHDCLLCDLFAEFLLTKPECGFVPPETDAIESLKASAAPRVEVSARNAACRGPPLAV